jgi:asparagine synthase (glutamine-hydrolysing)
MSAIAGILYFAEASTDPNHIKQLTDAMKHRGPDAQTHWNDAAVAMGHCMLLATPESLEEKMPLVSEDAKLVLVWDGRLDNREALSTALSNAGCTIRDQSDAELVLHAYGVWGEDCPAKLLGDFAFAVWDARTKKMFCARDHVGARPFYYVHTKQFFAFASEDAALTLLPTISTNFNEARVVSLLEPRFDDFEIAQSWLNDVWGLRAAQSMLIDQQGTLEKKTYWTLEPGDENHYASEVECQATFIEVFSEAVRCRMRTIGDVAAMMSGGLDSAGIAAMVKRLLPTFPNKQFHTYSTVSDEPASCKESRCILDLTQDLGVNAHKLSVPSFSGMLSARHLVENIWHHAHPVSNSIALSAMMCLAAKNNGHRVLLHGVSGDLVTHVPLRYPAWLLHKMQWRAAWSACCDAGKHNNYWQGTSALTLFLKSFWTAYAPLCVKMAWRQMRAFIRPAHRAESILHPALIEKFQVERKLNAIASDDAPLPSLQAEHLRVLFTENNLPSSLACYQYAAGKYGIELRDPWADRRVIEFFFRLPLRYKINNGWNKYLVRSTFAQELTPQVAWRLGKEHLGWHFYHQLIDNNLSAVERILRRGLPTITHLIDVQAAERCYAAYLTSKDDIDREAVYDIITLILWKDRTANNNQILADIPAL